MQWASLESSLTDAEVAAHGRQLNMLMPGSCPTDFGLISRGCGLGIGMFKTSPDDSIV